MPNDSELVRFLAEKVMGWKVIALALTSGVFDSAPGHLGGVRAWPRNWSPLESIADAFEVAEKCRCNLPNFRRLEIHLVPGAVCVMIATGTDDVDESYPFSAESDETASAVSLAIALAYGWEG